MTDNDDPSINPIPPIIPARDEVVSRQTARQNARPRGKKSAQGGGADLLTRLFIVISLVVAAVACAWAWQLQQELDATVPVLALYEERIADLEDRLSDTDEGMNQSAVILGVKIKELFSEVDKLWASAWRRNKAKIADLEKSSSAHGSQLSTLEKTDQTYSAQLKSLAEDMQQLRSVAGDLEQLVASAKSNQALMEQLGDDVSRATLEISRLQKQVLAGEEWQASVDGFRKQVNKSLIRLQQSLGQLQGGAARSAAAPTN
jgi:chromosome segregation ATPase